MDHLKTGPFEIQPSKSQDLEWSDFRSPLYNNWWLISGRLNGSLTQYKPDLKEAKTIAGPEGKNLSAISILWVSTYQFVVAYKDNLDASSRPGKIAVNSFWIAKWLPSVE